MLWLYPVAGAAGYLIGSVSFAVLMAKARGIDIFTAGSGNPGATNVLRVLGKPYGYTCFALDALKGTGAVLVGKGLALQGGLDPQALGILGLLGAILGHSYSVFLKFRGGKGVATTVGGLFALMPPVMLVGALLWGVVFLLSRYVSLASIVLAVSLPVSALLLRLDLLSFLLCVLLAAIIVVRHRANIRRLLDGTENRSGGSKL